MSQQGLKTLIERLTTDYDLAARIKQDPISALREFDLSSTELFTLNCADDDALRRLLGSAQSAKSIDYSIFRDAALPAFSIEARDAMMEGEDGGAAPQKTTKETSHTVTVCCWG